jgi:hypothetical protein
VGDEIVAVDDAVSSHPFLPVRSAAKPSRSPFHAGAAQVVHVEIGIAPYFRQATLASARTSSAMGGALICACGHGGEERRWARHWRGSVSTGR